MTATMVDDEIVKLLISGQNDPGWERAFGDIAGEIAQRDAKPAAGTVAAFTDNQVRSAVREACQRFGYSLRVPDIDAIVERAVANLATGPSPPPAAPMSASDHDAHGGKYLEPFDRGSR